MLSLTPNAHARPTTIDLQLAVVINGHPIDMVGEFRQRDGMLYATPDELSALGFRLRAPPRLASHATDQVAELPLSGLAGVTYRLNPHTQTVYFVAARAALTPTLLDFATADSAQNLPLESGFGAVANYNLIDTLQDGQNQAEGSLETRAFSPWGVASSTFLGISGSAYNNVHPLVRLDSTYAYSDPDTLRRYRAGDVITGGLAWSRPVRLGGIQITTDFSIRPDLVTFPVPALSGQVAVPSSVDVLVNGVQLLSRDVPPGPFEIRQLPVVTGAGDISVVIHNAVGQDTTETLPFYSSSLLLRPGLSAFSAELGAVRLNYGVLSDDYQTPAGSFTYRHGLLEWLTLETHGEGSGSGKADTGLDTGLVAGSFQETGAGLTTGAGGMLGGGVAFTMGGMGVVSLDTAGSRFGSRSGELLSASYQWVTSMLSIAGSVQSASNGFGDIASASGDPVPSLQVQASLGLSLKRLGSFGIAYIGVDRPPDRSLQAAGSTQRNAFNSQQTMGNGLGILPAGLDTRIKLISASYSRPVFNQRAYLYANAFHDFANSSSNGLMIGITIPLGQRSSIGAAVGENGGSSTASFRASQGANLVGETGWQVQDDANHPSRQLAIGEYRSPWGLVDAGFDRVAGQTAYRAALQGALAYADGGLFASNTVNDSFAVVDTDHTRGIQVLDENRPVGRTGSSGLLLVPDLTSFQVNHLAINPLDVPVDAEIGRTSRLVRPRDHSGVIVHFPVHVSHGALVRLVDAAGKPLAVGSSANLATSADAPEAEVGYDGEAFVTGLVPHDRLTVTRPDGRRCKATFDYRPAPGQLPEIGPVACRDISP